MTLIRLICWHLQAPEEPNCTLRDQTVQDLNPIGGVQTGPNFDREPLSIIDLQIGAIGDCLFAGRSVLEPKAGTMQVTDRQSTSHRVYFRSVLREVQVISFSLVETK